MFLEQTIKFEFRGLVPLGHINTPATGYFYDKTKISKENLRVDHYLLLKYCSWQCTLLSPTWVKSLTKFNSKMQDLKCFGLNLSVKVGLNNLIFSIGFQMLKI